MFWNFILIASMTSVGWACISRSRMSTYDKLDSLQVFFTVALLSLLFIVSFAAVAAQTYSVSVYERSGELVEMKRDQRDHIADIVQDELSNEQFAQLMAATPETDILLIIGNQATSIMIERSQQLVALNNDLYDMVNRLEGSRISVCAHADSLMMPRLFFALKCPDPIPLDTEAN